LIRQTLNYDFEEEELVEYSLLNEREKADRIFLFISKIWQIHPFREGNTRTIAVFMIKYLRKLGFKVDNEPFKEHSLFFRDA
jgi:fido (protein-threonine AMPylation protein)